MTEATATLLEEINLETTRFALSSTSSLKTGFDISPQEFIKYAETDLSSNYDHNIVNALSNSKRALDCQLDSLLVAFGYYNKSQKSFWSFPKKLDLIRDLGIIAPRVLSKVNKQRNLLEHQFVKPQKEIVEDFLDIAMLFIASTDRYTLKFVKQLHLKNDVLKKMFVIENIYINNLIEVSEFKNKSSLSPDKKIRAEQNEVPIKVHSFNVDNLDYTIVLMEYLKRIV